MIPIGLHLPQGVIALARSKPVNGILLHISPEAVLGRRASGSSEECETNKLLREVVALKQTKKR